jgi:glucosamine-6-phosphate deaminase
MGRSKASCVERAITGPLTTDVPASFLQLHHDVDVMLDQGAAERLGARGPGGPGAR